VTVLPERACKNTELIFTLERDRNGVAGGEELRDGGQYQHKGDAGRCTDEPGRASDLLVRVVRSK